MREAIDLQEIMQKKRRKEGRDSCFAEKNALERKNKHGRKQL
jgi:hypothetical protein